MLLWSQLSDGSLFDTRFNYGHEEPILAHTAFLSPDGSNVISDGFWGKEGRIFRVSRDGSKVDPLTTSINRDRYPVYSPSGKKIAFTRQRNGYEHIWLMDFNGSNQVQVTHGRVLERVLCFSADEGTLYFFRYSWRGQALMPKRAIFAYRLIGKEARGVERMDEGVSISPAGDMALLEKANGTLNPEIWVKSATNKKLWHVGNGSSPAFSSDGNKIVYLVQDEQYRHDVVVVNADGTEKTTLPTMPGFKRVPAFCLHDSAVSFCTRGSPRDGPSKIWIIALKDRSRESLTIE